MTSIFAHRGSKGTHPENTLPAFAEAVRVGSDGIELDVHLSKDGEMIIMHDEQVDRTTNGTGEIQSFTLSELKQLDAGSWFDPSFAGTRIPTLQEVTLLLEEKAYRGTLNIEIKTDEIQYPQIEAKIVAWMTSQEWSFTYIYSSFHFPSLEIVQTLAPEIPKAYIMGVSEKKVAKALATDFISAFHPKIDWVITHQDELANYPKMIRPWTVNSDEDMELAFQLGLTGIHTDYPAKAQRLRGR